MLENVPYNLHLASYLSAALQSRLSAVGRMYYFLQKRLPLVNDEQRIPRICFRCRIQNEACYRTRN